MDVLLISVRTDDTRLINRALTLALSCWPPKPGSAAEAVQPTSSTRQSDPCWSCHVLWYGGFMGVSQRRGVRGNAAVT
jgi:hypothetical protein